MPVIVIAILGGGCKDQKHYPSEFSPCATFTNSIMKVSPRGLLKEMNTIIFASLKKWNLCIKIPNTVQSYKLAKSVVTAVSGWNQTESIGSGTPFD